MKVWIPKHVVDFQKIKIEQHAKNSSRDRHFNNGFIGWVYQS
jgi:hypothetical protein